MELLVADGMEKWQRAPTGDDSMSDKISKLIKTLLYAILTNIVISLIIYFSFTWLSRYSLLYAYLGNLALIVTALALDEIALKMLQSEKHIMDMQKDGDIAGQYHHYQKFLFDSFVSFKTVLYLFYVLILIVSQLVDFYPALMNESLKSFVFANRYSILILIAIDQLIGQFSKDRERIERLSAKLKKDLGL